jgi:hypothetical protein
MTFSISLTPSFGKDSVFHQLEINASLVHQAIAVADTVSYASGNLFASCATNRALIIEMTRSTITLQELVRTFIPPHGRTVPFRQRPGEGGSAAFFIAVSGVELGLAIWLLLHLS